MTLSNNVEDYIPESKTLIREAAKRDGKLSSPIDLSLGITTYLYLDSLEWVNLVNLPKVMKITNAGDTVIISAQWSSDRPHLNGGPLEDYYVFSQIHFHWGAGEHWGSEHSIDGFCYPLEMHAVFYKSEYHSQDMALQKDDGILVVVYMFKLTDNSSPGIKWLSSYLDQVVMPKMTTTLPLVPLSSLLIPFDMDYIIYWGAINVGQCSHVLLWLVSRTAFGISLEDLNKFRNLFCSHKELINETRSTNNPTQVRTVFHVNPSMERKHFLLPGFVGPENQTPECVQDNYTQMEFLNQQQAEEIFSRSFNEKEKVISITDYQNSKLETIESAKGEMSNVEFVKKSKNDISDLKFLQLNREIEHSSGKTPVSKTTQKENTDQTTEIKRTGDYSTNNDTSMEPNHINVKQIHRMNSMSNPDHSSSNKVVKADSSITKFSLKNANEIEKVSQHILKKETELSVIKDTYEESGVEHFKESNKKKNYSDLSSFRSVKESNTSPMRRIPVCKAIRREPHIEKLDEPKLTSDQIESLKMREVVELSSESLVTKTNPDNVSKSKPNPSCKSKLPVRTNCGRPILKSSLVQYFSNPVSSLSEKPQAESKVTEETAKYETRSPEQSSNYPIKKCIKRRIQKPLGINDAK